MRSSEYWSKRATDRLITSEKLGEQAIVKSMSIYDQALKNIDREIKSIYDNYSEKGVLDVSELKKAIQTGGKESFLRKISKTAEELGLDPKKIYDERYLYRLTRLEALTEQVKLEAMAIAQREEQLTSQAYKKIIQDNYEASQQELAERGINPSFSTLDNRTTDAIMRSKWAGSNYSDRIWENTGKLANELQTILGGGLTTGQSYEKTARQIRERFDVSRYEAVRLVRTETNYFHGQSELQSYVDDGIQRYRFDAFLDNRTSSICRNLNGNVYYVKDARAGVNYNPMHPFCRSTTTAVLDGEYDGKVGNFEKRTERLDIDNKKPTKEQWKEAMQAQMNPNKATHDYNAEMNNLTQNYKGEKLVQEIDKLMERVPDDYPLKESLKKTAKREGWRETVKVNVKDLEPFEWMDDDGNFLKGDALISKLEDEGLVDRNVKRKIIEPIDVYKDTDGNLTITNGSTRYAQALINGDEVIPARITEQVETAKEILPQYTLGNKTKVQTSFSQSELQFIKDKGIKVNVGGKRGNTKGTFNPLTKEINIQSTTDTKYMVHAVNHEFGHAIDYQDVNLTQGMPLHERTLETRKKLSSQPKFKEIRLEAGSTWKYSEESHKLVEARIRKSLVPKYGFDSSQIEQLRKGVRVYTNPEKTRYMKFSDKMLQYFYKDEELFAEGYALFRDEPQRMQAESPKFFKYFEQLFNSL